MRRGSYVVCLSNDGTPAALEVRKIYATLKDAPSEKLGLLRVIDESGEDYLYPRSQFRDITLPRGLAKVLAGL